MVIVHYNPGFFCQIDLLEGWFSHLKLRSREVADSPTRRHSKADSLTQRVWELSNTRIAEADSPRLAESGSCFSIMNISANSKQKAESKNRNGSKGSVRDL
jgi:hypothetical protein